MAQQTATIASRDSRSHAIEIFHADSLAGPMRKLKQRFESDNKGMKINLTSGTSKNLADRILKGEPCDVFLSSSPAVTKDNLMQQRISGATDVGIAAASWYVIFSANEMVVIVRKGNPPGIQRVADLAKPGVRFSRVTGEADLATGRTIEFLKRAAALEGWPELAQQIIDSSINDPSTPTPVPDVLRAVQDGTATAAVIYYSAAVTAEGSVDIIRFPASINMSEAIRNAATVPSHAAHPDDGLSFVRFLLTPVAQTILEETGQPPISPPICVGQVPAIVTNALGI